jgi:hypothetical protein
MLISLIAHKEKETVGVYKGFYKTIFVKENGVHFATIPAEQKQPSKHLKTITINCWNWAIIWK